MLSLFPATCTDPCGAVQGNPSVSNVYVAPLPQLLSGVGRSYDDVDGMRAVTIEGEEVSVWSPLRVPNVSDVNISSIEAVRLARREASVRLFRH